MLQSVGIDQHLGEQIPPDISFRDEQGQPVTMGTYFQPGKPVVLVLAQFECKALCTVVLNDLTRGLRLVSLDPGKDYQIVVVSFDPRETPALAEDKKLSYTRDFHRPGTESGWHFLTGDKANIDRLTQAVGFRYVYDASHDQFVHPGGVMILTPGGALSRYFFNIDYEPKDLKLSLMEASGNKIGNPAEQLLLYCFQYDVFTGKYSLAIVRLVQIGAALTVASLLAFWFYISRRRQRLNAAGATPSVQT